MLSHIGHFIFTNGLLPLLKQATAEPHADVRVVTVASDAPAVFLPANSQFDFLSANFLQGKLDSIPWKWKYVQSHMFTVDMLRYSMAKLANVMFAQELQRRFDKQQLPVISLSVHPGATASENALRIFIAPLRQLIKRVMVTEDQGSFTVLFAATSKEVREAPDVFSGQYIIPGGKVGTSHALTGNPENSQNLWTNTTEEVNRFLTQQKLGQLLDW